MNPTSRIPIIHQDTGDLLGYVSAAQTGWLATTIFGYTIARTSTEQEAEKVVRSEGQRFLQGQWRYFDSDEYDWYPCVIKEAYESRVTVIRTNELGYQDAKHYKLFVVQSPSEETLMKS